MHLCANSMSSLPKMLQVPMNAHLYAAETRNVMLSCTKCPPRRVISWLLAGTLLVSSRTYDGGCTYVAQIVVPPRRTPLHIPLQRTCKALTLRQQPWHLQAQEQQHLLVAHFSFIQLLRRPWQRRLPRRLSLQAPANLRHQPHQPPQTQQNFSSSLGISICRA